MNRAIIIQPSKLIRITPKSFREDGSLDDLLPIEAYDGPYWRTAQEIRKRCPDVCFYTWNQHGHVLRADKDREKASQLFPHRMPELARLVSIAMMHDRTMLITSRAMLHHAAERAGLRVPSKRRVFLVRREMKHFAGA